MPKNLDWRDPAWRTADMKPGALEWNDVRRAELGAVLLAGADGRGCECAFYKLASGVGAKLYDDEGNRDDTFDRQNRAAETGAGPQAGETFEVRFDLGGTTTGRVYGYLTEVAAPFKGRKATMADARQLARGLVKAGIKSLRDVFDMGHISVRGLRGKNLGWIGPRLVALDFDNGSMGVSGPMPRTSDLEESGRVPEEDDDDAAH